MFHRRQKDNTAPSILRIYVWHLSILLGVCVLSIVAFLFVFRFQISPHFYQEIYDEVRSQFREKEPLISISILQGDDKKIDRFLSDPEFISKADQKEFFAELPQCEGSLESKEWGKLCIENGERSLFLPVYSADQRMGYLKLTVTPSLSEWAPYQMIFRVMFFIILLLLIFAAFLAILFYRSTAMPVNKAVNLLKMAQESKEIEEILEELPFRELQVLASRLAQRTEKLSKVEVELVRSKYKAHLGEMVSEMAHDVRSLLASLSSILRRSEKLPLQEKELLEAVASRIQNLADDTVAQYRKIFNFKRNEFETLDQLVSTLVKEKKVLKDSDVTFDVRFNIKEPISLKALPLTQTQLERVLSNLINNSLEAIDEKEGGKIVIDFSLSHGAFEFSNLRLRVSDNGKGMSEETLQKVRTQGGSYGKESGTGLGLAYVRQTVSEIGGRLRLESALNEGTSATMIIPLKAIEIQEDGELNEAPDLVLIDDQSLNRRTWKLEASRSNCRVLALTSEADVLENGLLKDTPIYIDKHLGDRSGLEVADALHSRGFRKLYITTSHKLSEAELKRYSFLSGVVGKDFPYSEVV